MSEHHKKANMTEVSDQMNMVKNQFTDVGDCPIMLGLETMLRNWGFHAFGQENLTLLTILILLTF